ncbi:hypothetical protein IG631_23944 [Alternaria alternata]|nr:hypothetical protein IG631_23944 [Alternaria alternata]
MQVAQLLDPDESISCSLCGSANNRCKDCVKLLKRRRNMNDVTKRLFKLQNKNQTGKEKGEGRGSGNKTPLNWKSIRKSCSKAKESQPSVGWKNWRCGLLEKANPSQQEKDAVLLIEAFDDPLLGWMLLEYSEADKFISRPCKYREILLYIMKTSQSTDSGPNRPDMAVQSSHKVTPDVATMPTTQLQHGDIIVEIEAENSPSNALEQHMDGIQGVRRHNSNSLPTWPNDAALGSPAFHGRQTDERSGVDVHTQVAPGSVQCNNKRANDEESLERKRRRLRSGQPGTHGGNDLMLTEDAVSKSICASDQESCMSTSPEQSAGVEAFAHIASHSTIRSPIPDLRVHPSPGFQYLGQTSCTEQGDCCLVYGWPTYWAASFLTAEEIPLKTDGNLWIGSISLSSLGKLPNNALVDQVRRSETWKKQSQGCKKSQCFKICLQTSGFKGVSYFTSQWHMATVFCTVPRNEAPELLEVY